MKILRNLTLIAILTVTPGCTKIVPQPPPGTYTPQVLREYNADQGILDLTALSNTIINLNAQRVISTSDLKIAKGVILPVGAYINAWGNGATTLQAVADGLNDAQLGPNASIVRSAINAAIAKYGATASPLRAASAGISSLSKSLSADAQANTTLKTAIAVLAAGFTAAGF